MIATNCTECEHGRPWHRQTWWCGVLKSTVGPGYVCDEPGEAVTEQSGGHPVHVTTAGGDAGRRASFLDPSLGIPWPGRIAGGTSKMPEKL